MQIKTACKDNMHGNERLSKVIWKSFPLENYDSYHKVDLFSLVYKKQKKSTQLVSNHENATDYSHEYNYLYAQGFQAKLL